ncbi:SsrA-binding protein [Leptospira sp. 201903070]|jgi:SsrA-binding protein|uniref:SsrA-binding protein n=3 Tax=Leptospira TaxID=171 RepID=A0A4R9LD27_9LEPT|nr:MULTISPECIES: SsrA-binding protein [Leptospira]AOP34651.1 SsrA-binding protein [Leptospira tipperaryensis]MBM9501419.1 SsrA-binding protein [Leptospira ainazelensis]MBM9578827.1 SsrA-binding protein [Leptospira ainlahdjerensis]RHX84381.1 SsrA-binding protein [Leptospira stimsonii]RHX90075.1 SsrA-binding protein [Leptospira stimsonii]
MADKKEESGHSPLVNKKAKFNFELISFIEAGIVLTGSEVKSLREKKGNLTDAFAKIKNGEIFLENFSITPYKNGGYANHPEIRARKLLLHKREIEKLDRQVKEKGLVLVATKVYFKNNLRVKVEIAVAKPKKIHDKRDDMQKKDAQQEIARALKSSNRYDS